MDGDGWIILTTVPDEPAAANLVTALVEAGAVACGTMVPKVRSIYRWEGRLEDTTEVMVICKTTAELVEQAEAMVADLHPYEVPEFVALPAGRVSPSYLSWLQGP